jgi:hypothetical protein
MRRVLWILILLGACGCRSLEIPAVFPLAGVREAARHPDFKVKEVETAYGSKMIF